MTEATNGRLSTQEKVEQLQSLFNQRLQELVNTDPVCAKLAGKLEVLQELVAEEQEELGVDDVKLEVTDG
jgi:3-oxoacyl-ACP reductase-like protein|tara:strand:- start:6127 stop:6336 length:210 start_codon:yes stop_codon:yes gene_type:complete